MSQIRALLWLNWIIFRHTLRSRKAAWSRAASALIMIAAFALSLLIAFGVGAASYFLLASSAKPVMQQTLLSVMLFFAFFMWATLPLSTGGGERFDPVRLLIYPISFGKLFAIDLLGTLITLFAVFAAPAMMALSIGVGLARGNLMLALIAGLTAVLFGLAATKGVEVLMSALLSRGRTRGETVLALLGVLLGFSGVLIGQILPRLEGLTALPWYVRWTPPGSLAIALTEGLAEGKFLTYVKYVGFTLGIVLVLLALTYRAAKRAVLQAHGNRKVARTRSAPRKTLSRRNDAGWYLPLLSGETSAVVEKELRYAARNAQLRALALMPLVLSATFRMLGSDAEGAGGISEFKKITAHSQGAGSVFYVFVILSALAFNLFAYEGAGMRMLILAPIGRQQILVGKNIAVALIALALAALVLGFNAIVFGEMTPGALLFAVLCFCFFAPVFAVIGNELSIRFPRRLQFGKKLNASGVAGLLMIPLFLVVLMPPAIAVLAGYLTNSDLWRYVILALFATGANTFYIISIDRQGRSLRKHELEILETMTGRDESAV
ncbi:MAG: hypothetical protein WKF84_02725 [Pyrinomonadaceae bacterium]